NRYLFDRGSVPVQESVTYLNALLFMLGAAYSLKHDAHVRVDIFYSLLGPRGKAWVNLLGTLLLLMPVSAFLLWICWDYVAASWAMRDRSPESGGLPYIWLLKSLVPVMALTLLAQGLAEIVRELLVLTGHTPVLAADGSDEAATLWWRLCLCCCSGRSVWC